MRIRTATRGNIPALQQLIVRSAAGLSEGYYTPVQVAALVQHVFGVDTQLIDDRTYYVIEGGGAIVACGGWSRRATLFGGDQAKAGPDPPLDRFSIRRGFAPSSSIREWRGVGSAGC